ncbi:MAG: hypothetical protein IT443_10605 [Phycisphaeraceae bacterium]|nr:hypothetical protein [Phycisphaeraceae bacterium]
MTGESKDHRGRSKHKAAKPRRDKTTSPPPPPPEGKSTSSQAQEATTDLDAELAETADTPEELEGVDEIVLVPEDEDEAKEQQEASEEGADRRVFSVRKVVDKRLDVYLQQRLRGISRTKVQQLIDLGGVTIDGKLPKRSTLVQKGNVIEVILPAPALRSIEPEDIPLQVVFEDEHLIVVNKQAGLIVHPARSNLRGTLINALAYHFKKQLEEKGQKWEKWNTRGFRAGSEKKEKDQRRKDRHRDTTAEEGNVLGLSSVGAEALRPGIVHRLDKNTTGVMVVAKSDQTHWKLARQFEKRDTLKAYLAVVHGQIAGPGGVIDQPLGKHPTIREAYAVRHDSTGRPSVTLYRVRERYQGYTLVELELKTGRTHQIRVHLSYLGHPLVGDIIYGGEPVGQAELEHPPRPAGGRAYLNFAREKEEGQQIYAQALARADILLAHPALHAALLRLVHPATGKAMTFTAKVHEPMRKLIAAMRQRPARGPVAEEGFYVDLSQAIPDQVDGLATQGTSGMP